MTASINTKTTTTAARKTRRRANRLATLATAELSPEERDSVVALALSILEPRADYAQFRDTKDTMAYMRLRFSQKRNEVFAVAFLDNKHRLIALEEIFQGTIDSCSVHPRVVAQRALELNAAALILVHNHPSGDPSPSPADITLTDHIRRGMSLFEIRVLDHIIVGHEGTCSLTQRGLL